MGLDVEEVVDRNSMADLFATITENEQQLAQDRRVELWVTDAE